MAGSLLGLPRRHGPIPPRYPAGRRALRPPRRQG